MIDEPWLGRLWIVMSATAGAVTGAVVDTKLNTASRVTAFFVGLTAAIFVGPLLLKQCLPWIKPASQEAVGFYYLFASVANAAIPKFIRYVSKKMADPASFLRQKGDA